MKITKKALNQKYYIVVPVFNEQKNIRRMLNRLQEFTRDIIVVNDGSTDNTKNILETYKDLTVINITNNLGKGAAMRKGAKKAWTMGAEGVIFMDGDNQHNPKHLKDFVAILNKTSDVAIGIRIVRANIPLIRRLGNNTFMMSIRILFDIDIPDILCGFRGFTKKGYRSVVWNSNDYGVETEMITLIGRKNLHYKTVVVDTIYLDKYKGFSVKNGMKILFKLPYWRLRKLD